ISAPGSFDFPGLFFVHNVLKSRGVAHRLPRTFASLLLCTIKRLVPSHLSFSGDDLIKARHSLWLAFCWVLPGCGVGLCAEFQDCQFLDLPATAQFISLDVNTPDILGTRVAVAGGTGTINWTSSHSADAVVKFYYHTAKTGGCSTKTFIDQVPEPAGTL